MSFTGGAVPGKTKHRGGSRSRDMQPHKATGRIFDGRQIAEGGGVGRAVVRTDGVERPGLPALQVAGNLHVVGDIAQGA